MTAPVLVHHKVDGWLVGGLGVAVWVAASALQVKGPGLSGVALSAAVGVGTVISAAHFGLSYHLAYRDGRAAIRRSPLVLLVAPVALALVLLTLVVAALTSTDRSSQELTSALITLVYLLTTWHYVKQVYGVARVGAAYARIRLSVRQADLLRYTLYPLWFLGAAQVLVRGENYSFGGFAIGYPLLPHAALAVLRVLAVLSALPVAVLLARLPRRPMLLVAPYLAAFLWLALPVNPALTLLLLAPLHALQYLAIGHRAEVSLAGGYLGPAWWLNIFAGAACGGLLLSRWVPQSLDRTLTSPGHPSLFLAAFFVFLNLHHYLIDATIWRSRGSIVKAMVARPAQTSQQPPRPALVGQH
jgi:hypothetical protein